MYKKGWMPTNRPAKLKMATEWISAFSIRPSGVDEDNRERWRVPKDMDVQLQTLVSYIQGLEHRPMSQHTSDTKKELSDKYDELTKLMQHIKRMCFTTPPCTDRDYIMLGLSIPDRDPTPIEQPKAMPEISVKSARDQIISFVVKPQAGTHDDQKADYGLKFKGCIVPRNAPDGEVSPSGISYKLDGEPKHEYHLHWDMFTRKKRFDIRFHEADFESRFYYCARYENSKGEGGPWSKIAFSVIV